MSEKERKFWMDLAIYKGKEFQHTSYGNGKIELFGKEDIIKEDVLYTVTANDLEDIYKDYICSIGWYLICSL